MQPGVLLIVSFVGAKSEGDLRSRRSILKVSVPEGVCVRVCVRAGVRAYVHVCVRVVT